LRRAQLLSEKRRRRRESHNAVERRRRDNINEKISELSTLIPECLLTDAPTAGGKDDVLGAVDEEGGKEGPKANKGMILRKSVDYIKYLQQLVRVQASRNRELESRLSHFRGDDDASDAGSLGSTSNLDPIGLLDLNGLLPIPDEDGEDTDMAPSSFALSRDLSNQILVALEANQDGPAGAIAVESPSVDDEEDEEFGADESERGRQALRRGRFGYPSQSVGKSAKVEEVDESALSDASGKMED